MIAIYAFLPLVQTILRQKRGALWLFMSAFAISTAAFSADMSCQFEKQFICQTFRLWYWMMYFALGAIVVKHESFLVRYIPVWSVPVSCLLFIFFGRKADVGGNEYLFGSIPCLLYAFCTFVAVLKTDIHSSKCIERLSGVFLPVFAFHVMILQLLFNSHLMCAVEVLPPVIAFSLEFVISAALIISLSLLLMRFPVSQRLMRI